MTRMEHEKKRRRHPLIDEAAELLRSGRMSRRSFIRVATLLGAGAGAATVAATRLIGEPPLAIAQDAGADGGETTVGPRPGGVLRCAMRVMDARDPMLFDWVEKSNIARHQHEYLTITGADNITRPMLAESWSASDDLKTWTFNLRPNVFWRNGDPFSAEDVAFNFARWLDSRNGSSNLGLFSALASADGTHDLDENGHATPARRALDGGVEIVDGLTVRLHLGSPVLSMPENLYNYPTAIVHRGFDGDITKERNGTGAYEIAEYVPGEIAILRRVNPDGWRYWGADAPHIGPGWLDEIRYIHTDTAIDHSVDMVIAGEVDMNYEIGADELDQARAAPNTQVVVADTARTGCIRMRVDVAPFDDWRVRRAVQLSCDPQEYPRRLFEGRGVAAEHHHVSPVHLDYFRLPPLQRNIEQARSLLADAGYDKGIDLTVEVGNTSGPWQQRACEILKEQAAGAGIRITVKVIAPSEYFERWKTTPFGLTQWVHRPLGTMALSLGYRSGVPWNETGFSDPNFDAALTEAEALLDIFARRDAMRPVEQILQDAAVMVQPVWLPVSFLASDTLRGLEAQPAQYHQFNNVWLDV